MYNDDYKFPDIMNSAPFWMSDIYDANDIILSEIEIGKFNNNIKLLISSLYDLENEDDIISSKVLFKLIQSYTLFSKDMYDSSGCLVLNDYYEKIIHNTNLNSVKDNAPVKYGISLKKTSIRSFPEESAIFSSIWHCKLNNFDRFQETACLPFEPVLILHESYDKKWYFVKIYNYVGWIKADDVVIAVDKKQIFDYVNSKDFLMVISKETNLTISSQGSSTITINCGMGTRLSILKPLDSNSMDNYVVQYPTRDVNGFLLFKNAIINKSDDTIAGNLPYTRYNIINQALKFISTPYDWGDKSTGKDCSSFILTIYKCFGLLLPRNADEQENSFYKPHNSFVFSEYESLKDRYATMENIKPGTSLFLKGHVMMYLGKYMKIHYMIHSFSAYGVKSGSGYESRDALIVAISPVDLPSTSGVPFLQKFTSAVQYI